MESSKSIRDGTLTGGPTPLPLCMEGYPLCRLKNPTFGNLHKWFNICRPSSSSIAAFDIHMDKNIQIILVWLKNKFNSTIISFLTEDPIFWRKTTYKYARHIKKEAVCRHTFCEKHHRHDVTISSNHIPAISEVKTLHGNNYLFNNIKGHAFPS